MKMKVAPSLKKHLKKDIKEDKMDIKEHKMFLKSMKKPSKKKK